MKKLNVSPEQIGDRIRDRLDGKYQARDRVLRSSREAIRHCSKAIRAVHRGEHEEARSLLESAGKIICVAKKDLKPYPDLLFSNLLGDAEKEYAEGYITMAMVTGNELPSPEGLGVGDAQYLNGMGEAIGELRRYVLDALRRDEVSRCEEVLNVMDDMYGILITIDFPDSLTAGLRRTTDMVRGVLERTRGDLTIAIRQRSLELRLSELKSLEN